MERVEKEHKEEIMKRIREAGDPENYETVWERGIPKSKKKSKIKEGGLSRAQGARFELKVRKDLEEKGRIVDKWTNNVEFEKDADGQIIFSTGKLIISRKYNPYNKIFVLGAGFPDFITLKHVHDELYSVIGIEVKMNGILSKEEKEKCRWYLQKGIFPNIWIAKKGDKRGEIEYTDFSKKYHNKE
ncbi:hypothetical protein A3K74_02720 [Candidatus Pacearchaeota archaeon RBG_13_33_26]|nr:MAG: hypothetical protein A3K74_02720 [Candidatus Pacearchaeota archaeon RBG_13_33_26]